jgi:hypothetical protein
MADLWPDKASFVLAYELISDSNTYVRMIAASTRGELAARLPEVQAECARTLLNRFNDPAIRNSPEWESYYIGLLNLLSVPMADRPLATRQLTKRDIRDDVLQRAQELASDR